MLLRGAGISLLGAAAIWTPAQLASAVVIVPISSATCFTDTAATTPAAATQTVKAVKDPLSGITWTQALAASTDRSLQQDASGKYYLSLGGGANDYLTNAGSNAALNGAAGACVGLACRPGTQSQSIFTALGLGNSTSTGTFTLLRGDGTGLPNTKWAANVGGHSVNANAVDSVAYTPASDVRMIGRIDPTALQTIRLVKNGSQVGTAAFSAGMPVTTGGLALGTDFGNTGRVFVGRIYGFAICNTDISDANAILLDTWLRGLMP